ncbi:MAG: Ig-like domain-containing protein [Balneolaceae bacterium]
MKKKSLLFQILLIVCGLLTVSCAVPIAPTGGPPDETGPILEYTVPETGTTNYTGNTFEFQFDEYINRSSVAGAITVEPDLNLNYEISWKRRTMFISFRDDLPDSTTIILKLDGTISDTRGNNIGRPTTLAISTGDEIDSGEIFGRILLADDGRGAPEQKILLYRAPVDFSNKANYEAQTDTGGAFIFSYLREGTYQALLVDDRNRNKIWDQSSESAQPFSEELIELEKEGSDTLNVLYTTQVDTTKPSLQGVGLFSTNRMRLRFSEPILVQDEVDLTISDSLGNMYSSVYPLYISPGENFVLFAQSEEALPEEEEFSLTLRGITDHFGNKADTSGITFMGSSQEDTTQQRIISANGSNGLSRQETFRVTYAAPITEPELTDSTVVIEGDVDFEDWPEIEAERNHLFINPQDEWIEDVDYQFLVWNPSTQRRKMFSPATWDSTDYGEIELSVDNEDTSTTLIARLFDPEGDEIRIQDFFQEFTFDRLPPVSYTMVVFKDSNENGEWDMGSVIPFRAPEPYYVQRGIQVQEGFTSQIDIRFN